MRTERVIKIARFNDAFRANQMGITLTTGVQVLENVQGLIETISIFDHFTEGNDPYGEHDFGAVYWCGKKVFWKIDYYDQKLEYWCDPLDRDCRRVMTIMLASEY